MVSQPEEGIFEEANGAENNIIIVDSTLRNNLSPQLKNMYTQYKVMFGGE